MGEELWYVKVADDDVHRMTLDQLDGAFQAGHIDESTMVLPADATKWTKLGELLGLDDVSEAPSEAPAPAPAPAPGREAPSEAAAPAPSREAPSEAAAPALAYVSRPAAAPAPIAVPAVTVNRSVTAPAPLASSLAPASHVPGFVPNTLRPMSIDLEDGSLDAPFRRSSRKGWVFGIIGVAAIAGGVGVVATRARAGGNDLFSAAAAAAVAPPPVAANPTPPEAPATPEPVLTATPAAPAAGNGSPVEASPMNPRFTDRTNEDPKLKLLAADKGHDTRAKGHHGGGAAASHAGSKPPKSTTFTTGGNKYDPLNSSI